MHAQIFVGHAVCFGRHGHQGMSCHAGRGVDFEQIGLARLGINHHIHAAPSFAAQHLIGFDHMRLDGFFFGFWQTRWHQVLGVVGEVFVLIVVVASWCHDANHWQGSGCFALTQNGASHLIARNELFAQNIGVALRSIFKRFEQFAGLCHFGHANGRAFTGRLHNEWQAQRLKHMRLGLGTQIIFLQQNISRGRHIL